MRHRSRIAGEHHGFFDAACLQRLQGGLGVGLQLIADQHIARIAPVDGNVYHRAGGGGGIAGNAQLIHQAGVACGNAPPVHKGGKAVAAHLVHLAHTALVNGLAVSLAQALADGVARVAFGQRGGFQQLGLGAAHRVQAAHLKHALREGAGFVEHDGFGFGKGFQIVAALYQNAHAAGPANAAEKGKRNADHQRTRAADDQESERPEDPAAPRRRAARKQTEHRRDQGQRQRAAAHGGGVVAGKLGDKVFGLGLFHAAVFHQIQNARHGGLAEFLGGANAQKAGHVHTAADHFLPGAHLTRQAFTGQSAGVQGAFTFGDNAVDGHALTGLHSDDAANGHFVGVHLFQLAVLFHVGVVGANIHQLADVLAAFAHGIALKQLTDLVKQHNGAALGIFAQRHSAHGGHRHQKVFIKHLMIANALDGLF